MFKFLAAAIDTPTDDFTGNVAEHDSPPLEAVDYMAIIGIGSAILLFIICWFLVIHIIDLKGKIKELEKAKGK